MNQAVHLVNVAVGDLNDANYLIGGDRNQSACFHCQQAAEKILRNSFME